MDDLLEELDWLSCDALTHGGNDGRHEGDAAWLVRLHEPCSDRISVRCDKYIKFLATAVTIECTTCDAIYQQKDFLKVLARLERP